MSIVYSPANIINYINGDLDVNAGYLGESVSITNVTTNVSLELGIAPLLLTKYYSTYTIQTESAITVTLPTSSNLNIGWYTRIDLISNTGTGSITVLNGVSNIAQLNGNTITARQRASVNITLIDSTTYVSLYSLPLYGTSNLLPLYTSNGISLRNNIFCCFFSYCDISSGTPIDANVSISVPLRWINPTGQFFDSSFYTIANNTRITVLATGSYKFSGIIGINNSGGSTQANTIIRPLLNGTTFLTSFNITPGTINSFADGVYMFDGIFNLNANDYIEIVVGKTIVSSGTNPVDLANTSMTVRLVGQ